jgi:hypothetical protein
MKEMGLTARIILILRANPSKEWRAGDLARILDVDSPRQVRECLSSSIKIERVSEGRYRLSPSFEEP